MVCTPLKLNYFLGLITTVTIVFKTVHIGLLQGKLYQKWSKNANHINAFFKVQFK